MSSAPREDPITFEIEQIRRRWRVRMSGERLLATTYYEFLCGIGRSVVARAQASIKARVDDINARVQEYNRTHPEDWNQLNPVTNARIAELLPVIRRNELRPVDQATISRWRTDPDCGVHLLHFAQLLYLLDLQLNEAVPQQPRGDLDWAGYERAMQHVLSQFRPAAPLPVLTPQVCRGLREDRLEGLHLAHTDAYAVVECSRLCDVLDCVWDVELPPEEGRSASGEPSPPEREL
jgi:hypothetical protein